MRSLLASPRRRRRAAWSTVILVTVGSIVAVMVMYPNTRHQTEHFTAGAPDKVEVDAPAKPLSRSDARSSRHTVERFVLSAFLRHHPDESFRLTAPELRDGLNREAWRKENSGGEGLPLPEYPPRNFAFAKYKLTYSRGNVARYDVAMIPLSGRRSEIQLFSLELRPAGGAAKRHWLVDYAESAGGGGAYSSGGYGATSGPPVGIGPHLRVTWLLLPLGILSLILFVPLCVGCRSWMRTRRAVREYEARPLPPVRGT